MRSILVEDDFVKQERGHVASGNRVAKYPMRHGLPFARLGRGIRTLTILFVLLGLLFTLPGCGGCRRDAKKSAAQIAKEEAAKKQAEDERKKMEEEKQKPDFVFRQLDTFPTGIERLERAVKPGHWISGEVLALANNYDFNGRVGIDPFNLDEMPFRAGTSRPAVLPKGQRRPFDLMFFIPPGLNPKTVGANLQTTSSREVYREVFPVLRIPAHQFYLVVLARAADQYGFLRDLDTVRAPSGELNLPGFDPHYRVLLPPIRTKVPVSSNGLTWTNLAYIVWDELSPDSLTPAQQQALLDWIHWGGQLIVSGPGSLALLKGSFLSEYLPAESYGTIELTADHLAPISDHWSVGQDRLQLRKPWSGEQLNPHARAVTAIAGKGLALVVDRRVGRGRISVTAFPLAQRELVNWSGFDNFFNGCVVRHPPRKFVDFEKSGAVACTWEDGTQLHDPRRVSDVRYLTRDAGPLRPWHGSGLENPPPEHERSFAASAANDPYADDQRAGPGVAGWDDFGEVSSAARAALREAAGIKIPEASFVVMALAVYLTILVPVNWGFFRLLGRVEWAWIAAPLISMAGAALVVRAAQLDIGFVRAANELAIVEVQADYPRAHVTRYTALYTSLSTSYDVELDDLGALVQPFPDASGLLRGQGRSDVTLLRDEKATLRGFRVASNSIGSLHVEHMFSLDGTIALEHQAGNDSAWQLKNGSQLNLDGVRVVQAGKTARVGRLAAGETRPIEFAAGDEFAEVPENSSHTPGDGNAPQAATATPITNASPLPRGEGMVDIEPLVKIAGQDNNPGEARLIGWTRDELPGMRVAPAASQRRQISVVVAHLKYGPLAAPSADTVTRRQVEQELGAFVDPTSQEPAAPNTVVEP